MLEVKLWCTDNDHAVIDSIEANTQIFRLNDDPYFVQEVGQEAWRKIHEWIEKDCESDRRYEIPIVEIRKIIGATNLEITIRGPKVDKPVFPEKMRD